MPKVRAAATSGVLTDKPRLIFRPDSGFDHRFVEWRAGIKEPDPDNFGEWQKSEVRLALNRGSYDPEEVCTLAVTQEVFPSSVFYHVRTTITIAGADNSIYGGVDKEEKFETMFLRQQKTPLEIYMDITQAVLDRLIEQLGVTTLDDSRNTTRAVQAVYAFYRIGRDESDRAQHVAKALERI